MPTAITPDTRPVPAQIAAAIGITADTGTDYQLTDAYGVTYTGAPAHLALVALARRDLSRNLCSAPGVPSAIRAAARLLIDWFTSEHTDPLHAAEFAALPPMRVCELVDYLVVHGNPSALSKVGPEALRAYTGHLLDDDVPSTEHPMPQLVDAAHRSLANPDSRWARLQVTATAPSGAETVAVPMELQASEEIYWQFTAAIPVPVADLNALLLDPDWSIEDYLHDHRELLDQYLTYRDSQTEQPLEIHGRLARPNAAIDAVAAPMKAELFFVGPDRDAALRTAPYGHRALAKHDVGEGDQIFRVSVEFDPDAAHTLA
ncbi:hypothetical protein C8D87_11496 [Lentzea atacamensis]|uniref:Uncharacterized protein n=1 Tax=Lentzea atacamensis TaxID=531938 RepID=A0ABX9DW08_9PSEU|nr:hypothetical protein [Lentzea atacamensis]RAS59484.1 hypothetical protein C8D87_11496 [Lentzea atacamensis]